MFSPSLLQSLEEEETMTPEQLAIKNVGKQVGANILLKSVLMQHL